MTSSFAPQSFKASLVRLLAPRCVVLLVVAAGLAAAEFRFDWLESAIGAYLVTTNSMRPESGAIWEQGRQSDQARKALTRYTRQRSDVQREARRAATMGQVVAGMTADRGAIISAARFVELYLKLPPDLSHKIVSPYTLLIGLSGGQWRRTFFELRGPGLTINFLGRQSQVLQRIDVDAGLVELIRRGEVAIQTTLHQLGDFSSNIFSAQRFFAAFEQLSPVVRQGVLAHPEQLLAIRGRITRVGIGAEAVDDAIYLGFEIEEAGGTKVILTQGRAGDVRRLLWELAGPWSDGEQVP